MPRFRIISLIALVAGIAAVMGAFRASTDLAAKSVTTVTLLLLATGTLGVVVRRGKAAFLGFVMFGGGYTLLVYPNVIRPWAADYLVTVTMADLLAEQFHPLIVAPPLPILSPNLRARIVNINDHDALANRFYTDEAFRAQMNGYDHDAMSAYIGQYSPIAQKRKDGLRRQTNARIICDSVCILTMGFVGALLGRGLSASERPIRMA